MEEEVEVEAKLPPYLTATNSTNTQPILVKLEAKVELKLEMKNKMKLKLMFKQRTSWSYNKFNLKMKINKNAKICKTMQVEVVSTDFYRFFNK